MLDPALRRDYVLTNIRGVFGPLMSEYVFGYLLAHERKIVARLDAQRRAGGTRRCRVRCRENHRPGWCWLDRRAPGGHGKALRDDRPGLHAETADCPHVDRYFHGDDKAAFASGLDYLVAVLPNTPGTRRIVDAAMLGALPAHAVVVNAGRGDTARHRRAHRRARDTGAWPPRSSTCSRRSRCRHHPLWHTPRRVHLQPHGRAQLPSRHRRRVRGQLSPLRCVVRPCGIRSTSSAATDGLRRRPSRRRYAEAGTAPATRRCCSHQRDASSSDQSSMSRRSASQSRRARALDGRSSGCFARHRRMTSSSSGAPGAPSGAIATLAACADDGPGFRRPTCLEIPECR